MTAPQDPSHDDSLLQALADPKEAAAYLNAVMELEDQEAFLLALRQVAQAHGITDVGEKTLFRVLSDKGNLTISALSKILHVLGLRLSVEPITA